MAKAVLRDAGVPVPEGRLCTTPDEAVAAAADLGPVAVKAQVLVGGRGKAGGIRLAETPEDAGEAARAILGMDLKGHRVESVYCEQRLQIDRELYLAITIDPSARRPLLIASAEGGIAIEDVPEKAIIRRPIDLPWGLRPFMARQVAVRLGLPPELHAAFCDIAGRLYDVFCRRDATLVECNPLAVCSHAVEGAPTATAAPTTAPGPEGSATERHSPSPDSRLIAADARLSIDDDALGLGRQPDLPRTDTATDLEQRVRALGLAFVQLDGDIAVMANGAGITMATLDALQSFGGRPMNFLDAGGGAASGPTAEALDILFSTNPKAVLVNIFGGITRCDDVARAIIDVKGRRASTVPLVVRLVGTNEEQGTELLRAAGISAFTSMKEAAQEAVAASWR